mgnify:CR=1 FL=1|tara:strand:- start:974 stop:1414 length:441 start_codon:yes stop_codon:yes gene_type:complete
MAQTDGVEVFEERATNLGWTFSYGNKANQNLIQGDLVTDKIYLLLDPVKRTRVFSEFGGTGTTSFSGSFLLLKKSTIDQQYYEGQGTEAGKYKENIKPLLQTEIPKLENVLNCEDYKVNEWSIVDVVDIFDFNADGIIVTYNISIL